MEVAAAAGLGEGKRRGSEVYFRCIWHDDHQASLRIHRTKNVWRCDPCKIGGTAWALMARCADVDPGDTPAVLKWRDTHGLGNSSQHTNGNKATSCIVAVYDYCDESGQLC